MTATTALTLFEAQTLASLTPADIEKVYSGKANSWGNHCRCGCQGTYRYSSMATLPDYLDASDVNDRQVAKALGIVQANADIAWCSDDMTWFDALVDGRNYTIYTKAVR